MKGKNMQIFAHHIVCANCGKQEHEHKNVKHLMFDGNVIFSQTCMDEWEIKNPPVLVAEAECNPA